MNSNVNIPADRADFIAKLKRVAKAAKRLRYPNAQLSELHDKIAKVAGYNKAVLYGTFPQEVQIDLTTS